MDLFKILLKGLGINQISIYSILILLLISYSTILNINFAVNQEEMKYLPEIFFGFIPLINYIFTLYYFRKQKIKRIYESSNHYNLPSESFITKIIYIVSLVFIIISYLLNDYKRLLEYNNEKNIIIHLVILYISFIPSVLIIILNSNIFFFSFMQQYYKLKEVKKVVKTKNLTEKRQAYITNMCYRIIDIKHTLARLINKMEKLYFYNTILGGISIGLEINYNSWDIFQAYLLSLFIISQVVFLFIIYLINDEKEDIINIVQSRKFAYIYLVRIHDKERDKLHNEIKKIKKKKEIEDFIDKYDDNDVRIHLPENKHIEFVKKSIDTPIDSSDNETSDNVRYSSDASQDYSREIESKIENVLNDSNKLLESDSLSDELQYMKSIKEWCVNTGTSVDWLILNNLLQENWASFSLFGIEFSNGSALSYAITTTLGIITFSPYIIDALIDIIN
jgi:hypothetical protein